MTEQDDDKEEDEDEDEEEASVAMVYLPRPQKPFGELGLIQPIQPSESPIVALEGPKPPDQLKVIYVPSWDVTAQVSTVSVTGRQLVAGFGWRQGERAVAEAMPCRALRGAGEGRFRSTGRRHQEAAVEVRRGCRQRGAQRCHPDRRRGVAAARGGWDRMALVFSPVRKRRRRRLLRWLAVVR